MAEIGWNDWLIEGWVYTIRHVGRTPYRIDFSEPGYETADILGRFADLHEPNAWSSRSLLAPEMHLPCIDVDTDRDTAAMHLAIAFEPFIPNDADLWLWHPSTTDGHWHLYIDWPIAWPAYLHILETCETTAVEPGYLKAARKRKATFVRMPHVTKDHGVTPEPKAATSPTFVDEEPF